MQQGLPLACVSVLLMVMSLLSIFCGLVALTALRAALQMHLQISAGSDLHMFDPPTGFCEESRPSPFKRLM
jgi:hypothetical protein